MMKSQDNEQSRQEGGWVKSFEQGRAKRNERNPKNSLSAKGFKPSSRQDRSIGPIDRSFALPKNLFFFNKTKEIYSKKIKNNSN